MKPIKFKGQTAVITGAASGMGLVASRALSSSRITIPISRANGFSSEQRTITDTLDEVLR